MGLLIGTLVAMSASPVVAVVVGSLASLLAVFLGLDAGSGTAMGAFRINGARIGSLGVATVVGLCIGLYIRLNNPFIDSPTEQLARWTVAFPEDPTLAKQLMIFERTGIAPSSFQFGADLPGGEVTVSAEANSTAMRQAVLFSTLSDYDACARLDPARYRTPAAALAAYSLPGAPETLPQIAADIASLPETDQPAALVAARDVLCILQREDAR